MHKANQKKEVSDILTQYLVANSLRKTPERFAILDAIYDMHGPFTLEMLGEKLEKSNFRVSRATLYNTVKLFIKIRLVVRHRFLAQTKYEACYKKGSHVQQVCTVCGCVTELDSSPVEHAVENLKFKRFRKEGYSLYIYGVCSKCQSKITRRINKSRNGKV